MKNFLEKILSFLPYLILIVVAGLILIFVYQKDLDYNQFIGLLSILVWPGVISFALLFFRKVFTYLFFSMEEFSFFGNKGRLKNIAEVIEERVQKRLDEEKREEINRQKLKVFEEDLKKTKESKEGSDKQADEALKIAREAIEMYKKLYDEQEDTLRELNKFREEQKTREAMIAEARRRIGSRRKLVFHEEEPTPEEIEAAGDEYISRQADIKRGK